MMNKQVFVGQYADKDNNNPQVLNTRALLSRIKDVRCEWLVPYFRKPDPIVAANPNVRLIKLWPRRFWTYHKFLLYQMNMDAIFYPNAYWFDDLALQLRKISGRRIPVITTLEGLAGNEAREQQLSEWAGHQVYCQHVPGSLLRRIDRVQREADHVIAISPFLVKMGRNLYGDKFSVLPLGIDLKIFNAGNRNMRDRFTVMGAGRLYGNKRPDLFLDLASAFPQADFIWYGVGEMQDDHLREKGKRGLKNVFFPGPLPPEKLADEFRSAHLFVLPSKSEGVPKVTQEAAACGLPIIIFGFYEAPSVIDGKNGYVVWNDDELFARVGELIGDQEKAHHLGECGAKMAKEWNWDIVAARWEDVVLNNSIYKDR